MYKQNTAAKTSLRVNTSYKGESIEKKVGRILNNKEPIKDPGVVLQYTDRRDGVKPEFDPRTDRWELAVDAMDKVTQDKMAKRVERQQKKDDIGKLAKEGMDKESGAQSADGSNASGQK